MGTRVTTALAAGRPVVVLDEHGTAELVVAAQAVTTSAMAFLIRHGSGFVRVALTGQACDRLVLPPVTPLGPHRCAQAVAVDAAEGVSTGISAADRCRAARLLADPATVPDDLRRPGHTVPLRAWAGGEPGVVEASVELATAAGLSAAPVLCGLVSERDPRRMAGAGEAALFARRHRLEITGVAESWRRAG
ncbi:3,4-dihydroxy-2-butanone-4-phosphate synthase [Amycolatopsis thermophila]|uniref:3,4-dihydroxy-2-butanone-4-phosphate synthase n=1 Tax=Amycolatopsis thermophila TaxID=206084 RepID=A0ABU0F762_9PSEU|nr:3,4-dihydroxy-2-butanone-4-phosphate synthase [Amycolatopsis thermophila]MDQ0382956.1 3,4-dihydroxy 2-butanone 4-phosphate synthase/GTP cyclohydrolase II [Amycolatopsis thermophila]